VRAHLVQSPKCETRLGLAATIPTRAAPSASVSLASVRRSHRAIPGTVVHPAIPQAHGRPIWVISLPTTLPAPGSGNRPPATTRRANPGNRPNPPNLALGTRPSSGGPITLPANPGNRPNQNPSMGPSTNKARGYKPPQTSNTGASPPLVRRVFRIRGRTRSERTRESKPGCQGRRQKRRVSPELYDLRTLRFEIPRDARQQDLSC
jgi:hypothetical protein